jgi:hypothetical protein
MSRGKQDVEWANLWRTRTYGSIEARKVMENYMRGKVEMAHVGATRAAESLRKKRLSVNLPTSKPASGQGPRSPKPTRRDT